MKQSFLQLPRSRRSRLTVLLLSSNKRCYNKWLKALSVRMREPISMQVTVSGNRDIKKKGTADNSQFILKTAVNISSKQVKFTTNSGKEAGS